MKLFGRLLSISILVAGLVLSVPQSHATDYFGNADTGFGGAVGNGTLTLTDNGTTISGTFTRGTSGNFNDILVLYIDSTVGGFSDTSGFSDNNDSLRKAISGFDGSNRSTLTFASFLPDYAIALGVTSPNYDFGGLWSLANGGANSLGFVSSVSLSPGNNTSAASYTFSFNVADLGLTPNSGATFKLFGTYLSDTAFRSTEFIAGTATGTQGVNPFTQTAFGSYTIVPEPTTFGMVGVGLLGAWFIRRRKV